MNSLSKRLDAAMKDAGVSQVKLAATCGVKPPSVNNWLDGKSQSMNAVAALRAAKLLCVNITWLVEGIGPKKSGDLPEVPQDPDAAELDELAQLSPDEAEIYELKFKRLRDDIKIALKEARLKKKQTEELEIKRAEKSPDAGSKKASFAA